MYPFLEYLAKDRVLLENFIVFIFHQLNIYFAHVLAPSDFGNSAHFALKFLREVQFLRIIESPIQHVGMFESSLASFNSPNFLLCNFKGPKTTVLQNISDHSFNDFDWCAQKLFGNWMGLRFGRGLNMGPFSEKV